MNRSFFAIAILASATLLSFQNCGSGFSPEAFDKTENNLSSTNIFDPSSPSSTDPQSLVSASTAVSPLMTFQDINGSCKGSIQLTALDGECFKPSVPCQETAVVACNKTANDCILGSTIIKHGARVMGFEQPEARVCNGSLLTCENGKFWRTSVVGPNGSPMIEAPNRFPSCRVVKTAARDCVWKNGSVADGTTYSIGSGAHARCANSKVTILDDGPIGSAPICDVSKDVLNAGQVDLAKYLRMGAACDGRFD